jgi:tetratricopeptide (TPR) repeat protein
MYIGLAHFRAGRHEETLKANEEARARFGDLVRDHPDDVESRFLLGGTWNNSGNALVQLKRHEEAVGAYREAVIHHRVAFEKSPGVLASREQLGNALGNLSEALLTLRRPAEAAAFAREVRAICPRDGDRLYLAARLLASCAPLAASDRAEGPRPDPGQDGRLDYLDEAMGALRQAVKFGFRDARRLSKDAAFAPLRPLADFRALVMDLGFPPDPFR